MSRLIDQFTVRRLTLVVVFTATWCGLWGEVSLANVVSGVVIAFVTTMPAVMTTLDRPIRFGTLAKLYAIVAIDLVRSTFVVVREILTPTDHTQERTVVVDVGPTGLRHLFVLVVAITLTPGTAVVDVDDEAGTILLHLLYGQTEAEVRTHVEHLVALAEHALPTGPPADAENDVSPSPNRTRS